MNGIAPETPTPPAPEAKKMPPARIAAIIGCVWFVVGVFLAIPTNSNPDSNAVGLCIGVPIMGLSIIPFTISAILQWRSR